jgi:HD-GYP domain-containing protein (c-di-GMP phosphodiesterase class II)
LRGEDIPLVARILAVGDAFSAMTTTRPYRKAIEVQEVLKRLGDAAGSQFDERLVTVFIQAIEDGPDIVHGDPAASSLWRPRGRVA